MYVSGELKEKTIEFLKKNMINFDKEGISTEKLYMSYYGEIRVPPWENNYLTKLKKRQEDLIATKEEDIKFLTDLKFPLIHIEICRLLQIIFQTSRKYTFSLLECFYYLIMNASNANNLMKKLKEFNNFISYIDTQNYNQIELTILFELFLREKEYTESSLRESKIEKFHIREDEIATESLREIVTFGEFASPSRVPKIATTINEEIDTSSLVAPIFFAIPDDQIANKFLKLCRTPNLDEEQVKKNATLLRIPNNLQNLIRR